MQNSNYAGDVDSDWMIFFEIARIIPTTIYCVERMYPPLTDVRQY